MMKILNKVLKVLTIPVLTLALAQSCARTATSPIKNKVLSFTLKVNGEMKFRDDITYYIVLYAPKLDTNSVSFDTSIGPRINAPDLTRTTTFLEGRLPFMGALPSDRQSKWTDFFYITGDASGKPILGKGHFVSSTSSVFGTAIIDIKNINDSNNKTTTEIPPKGFSFQVPLEDLNNGQGTTSKIITANVAVSDSIDNGQGAIFDRWQGNQPFQINLENPTEQNFIDNSNILNRVRLDARIYPDIPFGLNESSFNITSVSIRVI